MACLRPVLVLVVLVFCRAVEDGFEKELKAILANARTQGGDDTDLGEGDQLSSPSSTSSSSWAGHWKTDMGVLMLTQIEREVYGKFGDSKSATSLLGIVTTDPRTIVGELQMTAGSGGFKLAIEKDDTLRGFWWWPDSRERMPWSAQRTAQLNETSRFEGPVTVRGDVQSSGMLSGASVRSSTFTSPSVQENLPYMMSAVSCHWRRTEMDSNCGGLSDQTVGSTWGGMANVKGVAVEDGALKIQFDTVYAGSPMCFVSFEGKDTKMDYSLDTNPGSVTIFLKKNGCCATDWKDFDGKFSLLCHGASPEPALAISS